MYNFGAETHHVQSLQVSTRLTTKSVDTSNKVTTCSVSCQLSHRFSTWIHGFWMEWCTNLELALWSLSVFLWLYFSF